jgi:hypothetical protein
VLRHCRLSLLLIAVAALLAGCASLPTPTARSSTPEGAALLEAAAKAHGWDAYTRARDINLRHDGRWYEAIARVQPVLVDVDFRATAEERIVVGARASAKSYSGGRGGAKLASRTTASVEVWVNGERENNVEKRAAAALVLDAYRLFWLGPLFLKEQGAVVEALGPGRVRGAECDWLLARLAPGFGFAEEDRVMACVDRSDRRFVQLRLSVGGLASTRGAVVEVDLDDYIVVQGVALPTRLSERVVRPLPLPVRDWWLVGADVGRGYAVEALAGPVWPAMVAAPAQALPR